MVPRVRLPLVPKWIFPQNETGPLTKASLYDYIYYNPFFAKSKVFNAEMVY
jgi:hypothetical protein